MVFSKVLVTQKLVIMEDKVIKLSDSETTTYIGGAGAITATLISAVTGLIKTIYGMGQDLGSALKRVVTRKGC